MGEMIERVAKAISLGEWSDSEHWQCRDEREVWLERAVAAIEAMREPTDDMADRAIEYSYGITRERAAEIAKEDKWDGRRQDLINDYQVFIDAALSKATPSGGEQQ